MKPSFRHRNSKIFGVLGVGETKSAAHNEPTYQKIYLLSLSHQMCNDVIN